MKKDMRQLLRQAAKQGAVIERSNGGHVRVTCPNGKTVYVGATVSDQRAVHNARHHLRKVGALDL